MILCDACSDKIFSTSAQTILFYAWTKLVCKEETQEFLFIKPECINITSIKAYYNIK